MHAHHLLGPRSDAATGTAETRPSTRNAGDSRRVTKPMKGQMHGVRVPRVPAGAGWLALGAALVPIAYGLAVRVYRKGIRRGTRSRLEEPNAAMKPQEEAKRE